MALTPRIRRSAAALGALLSLLVAACGLDPGERRTCAQAATILQPAGATLAERRIEADPGEAFDIGVRQTLRRTGGGLTDQSVACAFRAEGVSGRFALSAVAVDDVVLTSRELFWLKRVLGLARPERIVGDTPDPRPSAAVEALYFAQQAVNATVLGSVYALVAIAFSLVYGIIRKINFAFGDIYMVGAVGTVLWTVLFGVLEAHGLALALGVILLLAACNAGLFGWASERLVFRKLRRVPGHAPLIAAIGLSILFQEGARLLHSARDFWVPSRFGGGVVLAEADGFTLYASPTQGAILCLALVFWLALQALLTRTAFGRAQRATADDWALAELLGVDIDRVVAWTFAIGGAAAGVAGFVIVQYYGVANFFMGLAIAFKALTAAIVGGIGSITGAVAGAMIVALIEVMWSAYLDLASKDVVVFAVLILTLVFRPDGLFGVPRGRGD